LSPSKKFTHPDVAGPNSFHFSGRINGRALAPGSYKLQAVAALGGGTPSAAITVGLSVLG
jgi:hypothetical protein